MGAVGIEIVLAVLVGYYGGQILDKKFGTAPWLFRLSMLAGVGAAIKALVRVNRQYQRMLKDEDAAAALNPRPDQGPQTPLE